MFVAVSCGCTLVFFITVSVSPQTNLDTLACLLLNKSLFARLSWSVWLYVSNLFSWQSPSGINMTSAATWVLCQGPLTRTFWSTILFYFKAGKKWLLSRVLVVFLSCLMGSTKQSHLYGLEAVCTPPLLSTVMCFTGGKPHPIFALFMFYTVSQFF